MMSLSDSVSALLNTGIGAVVGAIAVSLINIWGKKGESRATAADLVTNAAGGLIDRLERTNERLDKENKQMRAAIITLTDVVDEMITVCDLDEATKKRLHEANHRAKMVV